MKSHWKRGFHTITDMWTAKSIYFIWLFTLNTSNSVQYASILPFFSSSRSSDSSSCPCDMGIKMNIRCTSVRRSYGSYPCWDSHHFIHWPLVSLSLSWFPKYFFFFIPTNAVRKHYAVVCLCVCARNLSTNGFRLSFPHIFFSIDFKNMHSYSHTHGTAQHSTAHTFHRCIIQSWRYKRRFLWN